MKQLIILLSVFYSAFNFAQSDCVVTSTQNDIPTGGTYTCLNLYISHPLTIAQVSAPAANDPVIINVTNNVIITANINLNGTDATSIPAVDAPVGASGGPGAGDGGGRDFGFPIGGPDRRTANGSLSSGQSIHDTTFACGNGGGGGGFAIAGVDGEDCIGGSGVRPAGGQPVSAAEFDFDPAFPNKFRGGFGGGAGSEGPTSNVVGAGGGGGGGLYINAGGNITIGVGVTISAKGGDGGDTTNDSGGGGGGSGGAIWLRSSGVILNSGTMVLTGGERGENTSTNGHGGRGSDGLHLIEELSTSTTTSGPGNLGPQYLPPAAPTAVDPVNLSSDISCASINLNERKMIMEIISGFGLAFLLAAILKFFLRLRA